MDTVFAATQKVAAPLLRISLGIILFWIGVLKFVDPAPVTELLGASLPFLASNGFVYALGAVEIAVALALLLGIGVRYVGFLVLALFAGTLTIFAISPMVTGFPFLNTAGQFLLKDLVLFAATLTVISTDRTRNRGQSRAPATENAGR